MKSLKYFVLSFLVVMLSCGEKKANNSSAKPNNKKADSGIIVKAAPQWNQILKHDSGWIGADGIFSVSLDGVEKSEGNTAGTMFWFSDCILGKISGDTLERNWNMLHNSVAYMQSGNPDPSKIKFHWAHDKNNNPISMFEPHTPNAKPGEYYWLGDGVFNHAKDSTIYIFANLIKNVPGGIYPFEDIGVSLIALPKGSRPPFANQRQMDTPLFLSDSKGRGKVVFGISVLPNTVGARALNPDGYIYVYGVRGPKKELLVARVRDTDFENFSQWRYWDGISWNTDMNEAAALTSRVSNEMSVSFMPDGRVIATYQLDTDSPIIMVQAGRTPQGPFQPPKKVWETPETYEDLDFFTYNAKAHPHLSRPGELLISYNVNSYDFEADIHKHPHHLRPRFFTVKY